MFEADSLFGQLGHWGMLCSVGTLRPGQLHGDRRNHNQSVASGMLRMLLLAVTSHGRGMAKTTDAVNPLCCKQNSCSCSCAKCSEEPGHQPHTNAIASLQIASVELTCHLESATKLPGNSLSELEHSLQKLSETF